MLVLRRGCYLGLRGYRPLILLHRTGDRFLRLHSRYKVLEDIVLWQGVYTLESLCMLHFAAWKGASAVRLEGKVLLIGLLRQVGPK